VTTKPPAGKGVKNEGGLGPRMITTWQNLDEVVDWRAGLKKFLVWAVPKVNQKS